MSIKKLVIPLLVSMFLISSVSAYAENYKPVTGLKTTSVSTTNINTANVIRGDYTVSLASDNPPASTIEQGQDGVFVASYNFYAKNDLVLKEIKFKVSGLFSYWDIDVYVTDNSGNYLGSTYVNPDGYAYVTMVGGDYVLSKGKNSKIKVYINTTSAIAVGSTFSVGISSLKVVNLITGNNAIGSYNANNLKSSTFTVASICKFTVLKDAANTSTLVNGTNNLLKFSIVSNCDEDMVVESLTFSILENSTYYKMSDLSLYNLYGNEMTLVGGGAGPDFMFAAFEANDFLDKGQTNTYVLKGMFNGLNYSSNDMFYVRLDAIVLLNSNTAEHMTLEVGDEFDGVDNILFY